MFQHLNVPYYIGHKYRPVKYIPFEELSTTYSEHRRLRVFHNKGCKCITCGAEGIHLIKGLDPLGRT